MRVHLLFRPGVQEDRDLEIHDGATVADLLEAVGMPPSNTLVIRQEIPIPEGTPLVAEETLVVMSAASGG